MNKSWKPITSGILTIISGALGIIWGFRLFARATEVERALRHLSLDVLGFILLVLGIVAIIGGIFALVRKAWGMALAGAVCAIISPGFVLGVLATIFISLAKGDFEAPPAKTA